MSLSHPYHNGNPYNMDIYIYIYIHTSGWWFQPTPLKNDGVKVSWDDDIPIIWKVINHVPNHQPGYKELDDN